MPRVIIADDHALILEGVRKVLERERDMEIVGEARDFATLATLVDTTPADVLVMDVNMPGSGAIEALKRLRSRAPGLRALVLSMMPEEEIALDLLIAGAAAYVSKESAPQELVSAIRKVCSGMRHISPGLAQRIAYRPQGAEQALSPREREVLCLIARGLSVKAIAAQLSISISTVHTHRARVLQKLQLRSDVELSHYAIRRRLVF